MALRVYRNYDALSHAAAAEIVLQIKQNPISVLCLAAGETPRLTYNLLPEIADKEGVDFSRCRFVGLDEWLGIPDTNEGSCAWFLRENLFAPLNIAPRQINLFDGMTKDPAEECRRMSRRIVDCGGIDLMLVGIGLNGHIGFNEPGVSEDAHVHVTELDETTRSVGQKYFREATVLQRGITLGLRHLLESRKAFMMAAGAKKAGIIRLALEGSITTKVPASILRKHACGDVLLDSEAASMLTVI